MTDAPYSEKIVIANKYNNPNQNYLVIQPMPDGTFEINSTNGIKFNGSRLTELETVTYTASSILALTDNGKLVKMNSGSANNITIPPNSDVAFPINTVIMIRQVGAGLTSLVAGSGVTITKASSKSLNLSGEFTGVTIHKTATDTWEVVGDLAVA